jgi:CBS domain-containing protein
MLLIKSAQERVAAFLLEMADRIPDKTGIELPMSRQDIADYRGLSRPDHRDGVAHSDSAGKPSCDRIAAIPAHRAAQPCCARQPQLLSDRPIATTVADEQEGPMKAIDIMTRPVISIEPDATVRTAIIRMLKHHISALPVVNADGRLVGILSEGDLLRRAETGTQRRRPNWLEFLLGPGRLASEYVHTHARRVKEVMTADPVTVDEDMSADEIVSLMERHRIKRVPVMRAGRMVGIVSRANLMQALASLVPSASHVSADDATIRLALLAEMDQQSWTPKGLVNVIVRDGVVSLWGSITDDREREALRVLAENTPGVKAVRDHLVWVEPMSGMIIPAAEDTPQAKAS